MGLFGKSFAEKVQDAVAAVNGKNLGVKNLRAVADGKVVTLEGEAPNLDIKGRVVREFNALVDTENTVNKIKIPAPEPTAGVKPPMPVSSPAEAEQVYVVVAGDILSALAKKYYGKAGMYIKIFEANRDILNNPDLIKVGQKLRIPK